MADSTPAKLLPQIPKLNGTNWESWSFSAKASLLFLNALGISEGTKTQPIIPPSTIKALGDYNKCSCQGLSLILVSMDQSIHQSLNISRTLRQNWKILVTQYGTWTSLSLWVDFHQYSQTHFLTDTPLTQQIDTNLTYMPGSPLLVQQSSTIFMPSSCFNLSLTPIMWFNKLCSQPLASLPSILQELFPCTLTSYLRNCVKGHYSLSA